MSQLPAGWTKATLPEIVGRSGVFIDGDWVESKDQDPEGDVRLIQLADVGDGIYRNRSARFLTSAKARELRCTQLLPGDVLIARMPDPLGRACMFPGDRKPSVTVVDVCIVRPGDSHVNPRWLMHTLNAPQARNAITSYEKGTTRKRISRRNLAQIPLPLPPPSEQERVVAAIEEQFSRLDAGVAALERARRNLSRMRAAVLEAAVTGELVPHFRESAREAVGRMLEDRRRLWKTTARAPYKQPVCPSAFPLAVPKHWEVVSLESVTDPFRVICYGILMPKENMPTGVPYVRVKDMTGWTINVSGLKLTSHQIASRYARASLIPGDLLLAIRGSYGRAAIVPPELDGANITQDSARIAAHPDIHRRYLLYYLGGPVAQRYYRRVARGVAVKGVNIADLRAMPVPVPPANEQALIAEEVERRVSLLEEAETAVTAQLRLASLLRSSTLSAAFAGRLVRQGSD